MIYSIELTEEAFLEIEKHKKSGDKKVLTKIDKLLTELREHPTKGTGKPENLNTTTLQLGHEELQINTD